MSAACYSSISVFVAKNTGVSPVNNSASNIIFISPFLACRGIQGTGLTGNKAARRVAFQAVGIHRQDRDLAGWVVVIVVMQTCLQEFPLFFFQINH